MNKKNRRQKIKTTLGLGISALLFMGSLSVVQAETSKEYADEMEAVMDLIEERYAGGDVDRETLYEAAMDGMMTALDDYSTFFDAEEAKAFADSINQVFVGIGVRLEVTRDEVRIIEVFDGGAAKDAGIQINDIITHVDGEPVDASDVTKVVNRVIGEEGTTVDVSFKRNTTTFTKTLERRRVSIPTVVEEDVSDIGANLPKALKGLVAEVEISSFSMDLDEKLYKIVTDEKAKGVKYLIMDMRNNGGGYLDTAVNMGQALLPKGVITTLKDNNGRSVSYSSDLEEAPMQLVVLVNQYSASATEIFSAAVKDSDVGVVIGKTTFGKGVAQELYELRSGHKIKLTMQEFFSPKGNKINGVGVVPDIPVHTPDYISSDIRLMAGDTGEQVENMEGILAALGYMENPDDVYDADAYRAVMAFQKAAGLYPYGVCDYTTQIQLNTAYREYKGKNDAVMQAAFDWIVEQEAD